MARLAPPAARSRFAPFLIFVLFLPFRVLHPQTSWSSLAVHLPMRKKNCSLAEGLGREAKRKEGDEYRDGAGRR